MPQKFFGLDYKMMSPLCVSKQKDVKAPADQVRVLWMMETLKNTHWGNADIKRDPPKSKSKACVTTSRL